MVDCRKYFGGILVLVWVVGPGCGGSGQSSSGHEQPTTSSANSTATSTATSTERSAVAASNRDARFAFTDVTPTSGVRVSYQNGREAGNQSILESLGGGVAMLDFDGDHRLDLFFPTGGGFEGRRIFGLPSVLYRNRGECRFEAVSDAAGDGFPAPHYTHGAFAADYDNDGFTDLLVTGYGGLQLWHNQGDGTFLEVHAEAGLADQLWSSAAAWADLNGDGALDLYVCHYVNWSFDNHPICSGPRGDVRDICPPKMFLGLPDQLWISSGDGSFTDGSQAAGLRDDGKGLGVIIGDLDQDGDPDIYVANDTTDNFLYLNDGAARFEEAAVYRGVAVDDRGTPNGSMGVDFGDYNRDGRPDLWAANFEVESFALYRNDGNGQFLHVSQATGVTALNGLFVGFGTGLVDLDRDGDEDIVVANGHVINYPRNAPLLQEALLLENHDARLFRRFRFNPENYFSQQHAGRGLAIGDLDNDGDADLVFANNHEPAAVLRNDSRDTNHWFQMRLVGVQANRDAIGAELLLETSQGTQVRWIKGGGSYLSQNDLRLLWGVPNGVRVQRVTVRWPDGRREVLTPEGLDRTLSMVQGQTTEGG